MFPSVKNAGSLAAFVLSAFAFAHAVCPVDEVHVKGRVDHPPTNARVRIVLIYGQDVTGESSDTTLDGDAFRLSVDFLTQSRKPIINGSFEKCKRRPTSVIVTLVDSQGKREYDRVAFDFGRDFTMIDRTIYELKSEVLLRGPAVVSRNHASSRRALFVFPVSMSDMAIYRQLPSEHGSHVCKNLNS